MDQKTPAVILLFFVFLSVFVSKDIRLDFLLYFIGLVGFFVTRNMVTKVREKEELLGDVAVKFAKNRIDKADGFFVVSLAKKNPTFSIERIDAKDESEAKKIVSKYSVSQLEKLLDEDISKRELVKVYKFNSRNLKYLLVSILKIVGIIETGRNRKKCFALILDRKVPHLELIWTDDLNSKAKVKHLVRSYISTYEYIRIYESKSTNFGKLQKELISIAHVLNNEILSRTGENYLLKVKKRFD